jgi:predicted RNA-binding Zn-ribbon protein involved in translation (DUF1610 family)
MNEIKSRVSYLNGLIDGLDISSESKQGRVLLEVVDILGIIAEKLDDLEEAQESFEDYLDAISDDLKEVEDEFFGECDEDFSKFDEDDEFIESQCPNCDETIYLDKNAFDISDSVSCPNCRKMFSEASAE